MEFNYFINLINLLLKLFMSYYYYIFFILFNFFFWKINTNTKNKYHILLKYNNSIILFHKLYNYKNIFNIFYFYFYYYYYFFFFCFK